jgi:hypothetical protein
MKPEDIKPKVRVQVTARHARWLEVEALLGLHGTVQDPPLSGPHGYARVLFDQGPTGLVGIQNVHPESLQPEGAPLPGQSVSVRTDGPLSPDVIPRQSAPPLKIPPSEREFISKPLPGSGIGEPKVKPFSHCPASERIVPRRVEGCDCGFCSSDETDEPSIFSEEARVEAKKLSDWHRAMHGDDDFGPEEANEPQVCQACGERLTTNLIPMGAGDDTLVPCCEECVHLDRELVAAVHGDYLTARCPCCDLPHLGTAQEGPFCECAGAEERERLEDELDAAEAERRLAEEGDQAIPYREARRQLGLDDVPREEDIRRCGHDHDPGDEVCGECGAQLWSREDYGDDSSD